jgi:hypothetical protein
MATLDEKDIESVGAGEGNASTISLIMIQDLVKESIRCF